VWIALAAAIAVWIWGGASAGATAVPSFRIFALPGGPTGAAGGAVVVGAVVVLPGGPDPPVWAAAGTAIASTQRVVIPATARRRLQLSVSRIQQFSFVGLRG
jgi:hypothetical protein